MRLTIEKIFFKHFLIISIFSKLRGFIFSNDSFNDFISLKGPINTLNFVLDNFMYLVISY